MNDSEKVDAVRLSNQVFMKILLYVQHYLPCVVNIQIKTAYSIVNGIEMMMA